MCEHGALSPQYFPHILHATPEVRPPSGTQRNLATLSTISLSLSFGCWHSITCYLCPHSRPHDSHLHTFEHVQRTWCHGLGVHHGRGRRLSIAVQGPYPYIPAWVHQPLVYTSLEAAGCRACRLWPAQALQSLRDKLGLEISRPRASKCRAEPWAFRPSRARKPLLHSSGCDWGCRRLLQHER